MKDNRKHTLTIGIPAYNEQANIQKLLKNIISQQCNNFDLIEIIVNSDGSSDATVKQARELSDSKILVIDNKERIGKIKRINEIFEIAKGEIVALIDADVIPTSVNTFDYLIEPFINDKTVVYVSGRPVPVKPTNFIQQAVLVARSVWDKIRLELKDGKSVYTCHGTLYALRKDFAVSAPFPQSVWADIGFHYFTCIKRELTFVPAPKAGAFFKLPSTVQDYIKQISRYQREDTALLDYFGDWIKKEYYIPKSMLYKYKLEAFLKWPLHSLLIFTLNGYAKLMGNKASKNASSNWSMINSTKELINND